MRERRLILATVLGIALMASLGGCVQHLAIRERIAIDARDDCYLHSGADLYVYSDNHSTQVCHIDGATGNLDCEGDTALGNAAGDTHTFTGDVVLNGARDATTGNDYFSLIQGYATGLITDAKTFGMQIALIRPAGYDITVGDMEDAGLRIRVDTHATATTAGTVLRALDAEAKADDPGGTVGNVYGAALTAKSDTGAGSVDTMIALQTNAQNNAAVVTELISADFRLMRQAAQHPTSEYVVKVRNSSTTGTGCDAGIYFASDYGDSATTDAFDYGIDFSGAAINVAELRFGKGSTIDELYESVIRFSEFVGAKEQTAVVVSAGSTITPTGTYQPIRSTGAVTTSTSNAIADGVVNGQLLILVNENASDVITIDDGANTRLSGDIALGPDDTLMLIWDGANWLQIGTANNS